MASTINATLVETFEVKNTLGEGVLWRLSDKTLWWTDIEARKLYVLDWRSKAINSFETPERAGSFGFVEGRDDILVVAFESGFALFQPDGGKVHWLARPAGLGDGVRLNDGRVDPFGRFWAGSMIERELRDGETPDGRLYMLDTAGAAHIRFRGAHISNGLCWSPGGARIYFSDSMRREIMAAPFDGASAGEIAFGPFAKTKGGAPDGAVTDRDGRYWSALWGAARIDCLSPAREILFSLPVNAPQPTCPAFGGPDGNLLFVTSARYGLNDADVAASPQSGAVFVFETNTAGTPAQRVKFTPSVIDAAFPPA